MSSSVGSASVDDVEDWLDVGDSASLPSLSLDDVLNEVDNLDESVSLLDDVGIADSTLSLSCLSPPPTTSPSAYQLDSAVLLHRNQSISHQLQLNRAKSGTALAVAERHGRIAIATSKGHVLLFDKEQRLDRFFQGDESTGSASCVAFSPDGKFLAIGFSKGGVKILNVRAGSVYQLIREAVQPGMGVLQVQYLSGAQSLLTLDNGGSVYEIRFSTKFSGRKESRIRCVFSGCNGEVVHLQVLPGHLLALLTVSKVLLVSTRFGGAVLGTFPLQHSFQYPPLFAFWIDKYKNKTESTSYPEFRICIARGEKMVIFRLHTVNFGTRHKSATLHRNIQLPVALANLHWLSQHLIVGVDPQGGIWQIDPEKGNVSKSGEDNLQLIFATSDYKGLATGGKVSEAMRCIAELACFQSTTSTSSEKVVVLAHDGLFFVERVTELDQLDKFRERDDEVSAALYLLDVTTGRVRCSATFSGQAAGLLMDSARRLLDVTMDGCKEGKVAQLVAHYKKYVNVLLHVCITGKLFSFLYDELWNRLSQDVLSRGVMLEALDEWILDGALQEPPPTIVSEYLSHLAAEGHFSQLQAAVVRFPIHSIDLHSVMSTCRQNGLYDGIIYVMNNALDDFISPLEEMLDVVREFAGREVLTDWEVDAGNRLLLYLHCCLAGRAYPYGMLSELQAKRVPLEVYRCICSLKGKDGSSSDENFPYLRLLLQFDPQQFVHVIYTCADASLFQNEGRLQRLTDTIGLLSVAMRKEAPLMNFLLLVVQLTENSLVLPPVEFVQDAIIALLRLPSWQHPSTETIIVTALRVIGGVDKSLVLRSAQSPLRTGICTFIYLSDRKYIELVKCYLLDSNNKEVFGAIDRILKTADLDHAEANQFAAFIRSILPTLMQMDPKQCAALVVLHHADYLNNIASKATSDRTRQDAYPLLKSILELRARKKQRMISIEDDIDDTLFGIVFEGICRGWKVESSDGKSANQESAMGIQSNGFVNDVVDMRTVEDDVDQQLVELLAFWLPLGSRTDFCLNEAVRAGHVRATVALLEARGFEERAFNALFEQLQKVSDVDGGGDDDVDEAEWLRWLDETLNFCTRHSTSADSRDWMMRVFRLVAPSAVNSYDFNERLHSLCRRILDTGTEYAEQLVSFLFECPAFRDAPYSENSDLINSILTSCDYEARLLSDVLSVIAVEASKEEKAMRRQMAHKFRVTMTSECIRCAGPLNKASYVFRCGHVMHMDCVDRRKTCPCEGSKASSKTSTAESVQRQPRPSRLEAPAVQKRDIFAAWNRPLKLFPDDHHM